MQEKSQSEFLKKLGKELQSTSPLFKQIIQSLDEALSQVPTHDNEGCDIEDSMHFDTYVSSLTSVSVKEESGNRVYPIDDPLAIKLIYDEVKTRRQKEFEAQAIAEAQDA